MKKNLIALLLTITTINLVYSQSWYSRQSLPSTKRGAAAGFSIGNIGYIIGGESSSGNLTDVWAYNSVSNSWSSRPSFPGNSRSKPVGFSINGSGYYGFGTDSSFYKFNPTSNTWTQLSSPNLGVNYWSAMYFTIDNDAYFLFASSNTFVKYNTVTNSWTTLANFPGIQRFTGSGFSINGKGYITCGVNGWGNPYLNDLWEYNPSSNTWSQKSSLPATGRYATIAYSMNGNGYLLCGERYNPNATLSEFWQYNPISDSWSQLSSFVAGARNYLSGFVIGNNIYAGFGGFGHHSDFYLYGIICNNLVSINNSIVNASSNSNAIFNGSSNNPNSTFQWQSNPNHFGWQNVPNNSNYSGNSTNSLTVNNVQLSNHLQPFRLIATTGNCIDTSNIAIIKITDTCIVTINDTITTKITKHDTIKVTDTLVINATLSGVSAPNNTNRLLIYPNPAKDHITIDYGVFGRMSGYTLKIVNTLGQIVFSTPINQQSSFINLSTWTGKGMYYVQIYDASNTLTENRKIVLQ